MAPLITPWLKNKTIPLLSVRQQGHRLIIRQESELLLFPLTIRLKFKNGTSVDKTIVIDSIEQSLGLPDTDLENYLPDPGNKVLFQTKTNT